MKTTMYPDFGAVDLLNPPVRLSASQKEQVIHRAKRGGGFAVFGKSTGEIVNNQKVRRSGGNGGFVRFHRFRTAAGKAVETVETPIGFHRSTAHAAPAQDGGQNYG